MKAEQKKHVERKFKIAVTYDLEKAIYCRSTWCWVLGKNDKLQSMCK